jgi:hypothetical protein
MAITIKHAKTDTIADWTQSDLDAQIALGNFPPGTVLADIVLPSDWNNDHTILGTVPIANGGTGQTTAITAINALLPSQSSQSGKVLSTDGTNTSWIAAGGTGTVTSVTGTAPVSVATGTTTPVISMAAATGSVNGYLTSTDWTTFNSKAPATSGTSILYGNGSGGFSNVTVGSGLSFSTGTLSATGGSMVYPGAGIPNSTGSAWGTSYTTTGSGTVVALQTGASLSNPTISNYEDFTSTSAPSYTAGRLWYDSTQKALTYFNDVTNNQVHIGQEVQLKVINNTGSTIANGVPVYVTSTSSGASYPNVALAQANSASTSAVIGLTNGSIANGATGYVVTSGLLTPANTGSFAVGDVLYLSPYSAGQMMNTVPPTGYAVQIGTVAYANTPNGSIYIKQTTPLAVSASTIVGQVALANGGTNANLTAVNGGAVYSTGSALAITAAGTSGQVLTSNGAGAPTWTTPTTGTVTSVTGTSPISSSGGATPAISISQATTSTNGYLSSTDWNTFNGKQTAYTNLSTFGALANSVGWLYNNGTGTLSYSTPTAAQVGAVPTTRSLTINGTAYDLSADRTWSVGTVTSVAALTLGTSGTDLSSTVATGTTTPVITLNVPTASATNRGALSSADWTTFNNKGSGSVTTVSVVSANGFAGTVANASTTPAITLTTSITGVLKGNGTAISAATAGTDYSAGTSALSTGILKSTTTTGALSIAVAADFPTLNQNTTGSAGSVANALTAGTGLTASATYNGSAAITFNATGTTINSQTTGYTLVAGDAGKTISITTGGVTVPSSVLAAGNIVTIYNNSASSQTITQGASLTLQWAGQTASTTGNRTLGLYGIATIVYISATLAVITGSGLT